MPFEEFKVVQVTMKGLFPSRVGSSRGKQPFHSRRSGMELKMGRAGSFASLDPSLTPCLTFYPGHIARLGGEDVSEGDLLPPNEQCVQDNEGSLGG